MIHRDSISPVIFRPGFATAGPCVILMILVTLLCPPTSWSQVPPQGPGAGGIFPQPVPSPPQLPPPAPMPDVAPPAAPGQRSGDVLGAGLRVLVKEIRVVGNTAVTAEQLKAVTAPYENRELAMEDLEALRLAVTVFYVKQGYVTSGALLPDQEIRDGVVTLQVIEGTLADINLEGNRWFWKYYYTSRIRLAADTPLNINRLQERLQLLQTDPRLQRVNAELKPGVTQDQSVLNVRVTERRPFHLFFEFNNFLSRSVGAEQGSVTLTGDSLLGLGDRLSLQYGRSAGVHPIMNFRYEVPVTPWDTTIFAGYRRTKFAVKESPLNQLDIVSEATTYTIGIRQPLYRSIERELAVSIAGEHERNESTVLGEPFSFIAGSVNGQFKVSALRLGQEYVQRTQNSVFSLMSRISIGIGVLDATTSGKPDVADGRFFSWLGQAQYFRTFEQLHRTQVIGRALVQISRDHLFPLEQTAVGGRFSVRGYREYSVVSDNAALASLETRIPVFSTDRRGDILLLAPFVDYGRAWNTSVANPHPQDLASVGVGMIVNLWEGSHFEVYWGQQLNRLKVPDGGTLQDHGIHLQMVVQAF